MAMFFSITLRFSVLGHAATHLVCAKVQRSTCVFGGWLRLKTNFVLDKVLQYLNRINLWLYVLQDLFLNFILDRALQYLNKSVVRHITENGLSLLTVRKTIYCGARSQPLQSCMLSGDSLFPALP